MKLCREDAGNYICVATSARVFDVEAVADVEVVQQFRGKLPSEDATVKKVTKGVMSRKKVLIQAINMILC